MFSELCSGRDGQILVDQGGFCEETMLHLKNDFFSNCSAKKLLKDVSVMGIVALI